jgi:hypothetical protein
MSNRLLIASTALTAVVGLSASVAISMAGSNHTAAKSAAASSAGANHVARASAGIPAVGAGGNVAPTGPGLAAAAKLANAGTDRGASNPAGAASSVASAAAPTLLTVQGGARTLAGGAQKATPVSVSEDQAMQAVFKGGMWLPNATGGREYAKYDHHLVHADGDWTWVGKVQTAHGLQSAVITFGKDAVFGRIPQASGQALRLVTSNGQKMLVQTDGGKMAASAENVQLYARQDFRVPQHKAAGSTARSAASATRTAASAQTTASASTTGGPTIDVMVAYTNGFASANGGTSSALTRINNLVDVTNQAYADSGVNQRIRLVHTMAVSYTDTNDNTKALDDVTGNDGSGNSVPIPSSLQGIASARNQYGADLVVLLRHFNDAGNNGCGVAWLIGGGAQQIVPSEDNAFGYAVVQDGSDAGFFCLDSTFAHELGHTMGSAHDRAHSDQSGAYSYSYGYVGNGTDGFSTIMAYGSNTQTPLDLFSNPNVSKCENSPCGVADGSTSSADNVHSLNNTASLIAQFEATKVADTNTGFTHNDVNGDGKSDLFWYSPSWHEMTYWLMNGTQMSSWKGLDVPADYHPAGVGDFNGDHRADILWTDNSHHLYMWANDGAGGFTSHLVVTYKSYSVAGVGDVDGDGKSDIIWFNQATGGMTYWLMDGWTLKSWRGFRVKPINHLAGVGDFNGDGRADLLWAQTSTRKVYAWIGTSAGGFAGTLVNTHQPGWSVSGVGDADGDGKSDIYWYNQGTGQFVYWLMNGTRMRSWHQSKVVTKYHPIAFADYNGDGRADVLWTSADRHLWMWLGDDSGGFNKQLVVVYSSAFMPFGN